MVDRKTQPTMRPPKTPGGSWRFHWVRDQDQLEVWEWKYGSWWRPGVDAALSPEEAAEWGWTYEAPAIPPGEGALDALRNLLRDVEGEHAGRAAYGMEITDPGHPWHLRVIEAREAIARAEGRVA